MSRKVNPRVAAESARRIPCPSCRQPNYPHAANCWACNRPIVAPAPPAQQYPEVEIDLEPAQPPRGAPLVPNNQPPTLPGPYAAPPAGPPVFYKNPAVATILSFFIPGIGQIYNGQIGKAVAFLVVWFFCACILFIPLIGWLIAGPALAVWIWSMIDAYSGAEAVNRELSLRQQYPDWRR